MMKTEEFNGENIGVISLSRPTSHGTELVGSKVPNDTFISLSIKEATATRGEFSSERIRGHKEIIQVNLSPMQYAELISSIGMAAGVPCTITRRDGKRVPQEYSSVNPQSYYTNKVKEEFMKMAKDFESSFAEAKDLLHNKKTLNKGDKETIELAYNQLHRRLTDSLPFMHTLFQEEMDTVVMEASQQFKSNISASIEQIGKEATYEAIQDKGDTLKIN